MTNLAPPTSAHPEARARVGAVVIGRNEGQRLRRCLESLAGSVPLVVYVDSQSTDDSVAVAEELGAELVVLDMAQPFSAARARNAGFARLRALDPTLEHVLFIDGDCQLDPRFVPQALAHLATHPATAVVCGRRRELHPERSVYNRLCDLEWNTKVGQTRACGGDALMRATAFAAVGGFDPSVIAGEEPDLCYRLLALGWEVWRIDADMTLHDADMTRFSQWWTRNLRSGHATAEALQRRGLRERDSLRQVLSNTAWSLPVSWPFWPVLYWRVYRRSRDPVHAAFIVLGKLPHSLGQLRFWRHRLQGRRTRLIEYK